ncbi:MAG: oligosaccharide flippase family protein, partial [Alistipes sp.]|nr:oligosaccharide flippase family protein [Alistipes sp.]
RVLQMAVRAVLLWWVSDWRPRGAWDGAALRRMAPYSFSLMATDLFSTFYNKVPQFFLGRLYPADVLGAFDQAVKLKDQPVVSAVQSVQNVTFPALSKIGDDPCRFAESYRQIVMIVTYVLFPVMMGLSAIAPDLFAVLLGAEWMQTVPYFEVICLAGLCYPIAMIAFTVLKVKSDGGIIVRTELLKKGMMTLVFVATIPVGVQAVVWGLVVIAFCEMAVNVVASMRFTVLRLRQLLRTLLPIVCATAVMYATVRWSLQALPFDGLLRLLAEIGIGAAVYVLFSALFRLEAFRETVALARRFLLGR